MQKVKAHSPPTQRDKFEDARRLAVLPDPSGPLRRCPAWIFDNQVEHASREMTKEVWFDHSH
jgi:hypothetical protein